MTNHPPCGKEWTGKGIEHCAVCCQTFTGTLAGDRHRVGTFAAGDRRCRTPDEMLAAGLVPNERGIWRVAPPADGGYWSPEAMEARLARAAGEAEGTP